MKVEVSDDFVNMLLSFDKDMAPSIAIYALKWASENSDKTPSVVEGWKKLKSRGKKEFQWRLSLGSINPAEALDYAVKYEARIREQSSLLREVLSKAKKEGYALTLPNSVQCKIQRKEGEYWFIFNVQAEEIILFYSQITYDTIEVALKYSQVNPRHLYSIVYKGKVYEAGSRTGKALQQAIEQNIHPNVAATVSPT